MSATQPKLTRKPTLLRQRSTNPVNNTATNNKLMLLLACGIALTTTTAMLAPRVLPTAQFEVGQRVRCRDTRFGTQDWREGVVTQIESLRVQADGRSVGVGWDEVESLATGCNKEIEAQIALTRDFKKGDRVEVIQNFRADCVRGADGRGGLPNAQRLGYLDAGMKGIIRTIDDVGDAYIYFDGLHYFCWVFKAKFHLLKKIESQASEISSPPSPTHRTNSAGPTQSSLTNSGPTQFDGPNQSSLTNSGATQFGGTRGYPTATAPARIRRMTEEEMRRERRAAERDFQMGESYAYEAEAAYS